MVQAFARDSLIFIVLSKVLLSEVILVDKDFDSYRIIDGSHELIFPLKELKAVTGLAEALGFSINIHFQPEAGTYDLSEPSFDLLYRPITFSIEAQQQLHLTVDVVLATQVDSAAMTSPGGTPSKAPTTSSPAPSPHPSPAPSAASSQQAGHSRPAGLSGLRPVHNIPGLYARVSV